MKLSLHTRLVAGFLAAIVTTGLVSSFIGAWMIGKVLTAQAQDKARHDLNAARLIYQGALSEVRDKVRLAALSPPFPDALDGKRLLNLSAELERIRTRESLDFLDLLDLQGRVILRAQNPGIHGDTPSSDAIVQAVLAGQDVVVGTTVADRESLRKEGPALAEQARIAVVAPAGSKSPAGGEETSGMLIKAVSAIARDDGRRLGFLSGGRLLNRDTRIVDAIKRTAYQGETYRDQEVGEGTICLGDIRIATNVKLAGGERAVGTRVDQAVRQRVLGQGKPFVAPAMVVSERHITAYEPIRDPAGRVIGILSLGVPERMFTAVRTGALAVFFGITLGGIVLSFAVSGFMTRRIMRPISGLVAAVRSLAGGNLDQRVEPDGTIREIGLLGEGFNTMAASIKERDLQLKYRTQERVGKAERLAMVGRLAAGVAHEINNPLGGIMLFSNLLLRKAPPEGPERENLERIAAEAKRCQRIVQGLLDFSRQREPKLEVLDICGVIDKTLQLVEHQAMFHDIQVVRSFQADRPTVRVDASQMQQVFINLFLNAVEAMQGKGTLTIRAAGADRGESLQVSVADTGCGIAAEHLDRLFEPFFTTREVGRGTGLGLSISRGIVENHGGTIWAESRPGEGATFFIRLPAVGRTP